MYSLGVDVGSVSTDFVLTDENRKIIESLYLRTHGDPAGTVARGMKELKEKYRGDEIFAVGTTGSGRMLAGSILGADVVKNEITAHGVAASVLDPEVKTVIEIGGQDSKIILLEKGVIRDFAMNTVCATNSACRDWKRNVRKESRGDVRFLRNRTSFTGSSRAPPELMSSRGSLRRWCEIISET